MTDSDLKQITNEKKPITPFNCFSGSAISGVLAFAAYKLMISIATIYAQKPVNFTNPMAINIASAVRTLVVGVTALAACMFSIVTLGLFTLGLKLLWEKFTKEKSLNS